MWLFCVLALFMPLQDTAPEEESQAALASVRRIYIDDLSGGETAVRIRDLLMASLHASKLFIITENQEKADAVLKGSGEDTVFTDSFQSTEGVNVHSQISTPDAQSSSKYSNRITGGLGFGDNESIHKEERKHEAIATVRLVGKDGDVIWSTTQESLGGKFLGAAADVADKVTRRLSADYRKAKGSDAPAALGVPKPSKIEQH